MRAVLAPSLALMLGVACAHGGQGDVAGCRPPAGALDSAASTAGWAGEYHLTVVSTEGEKRGASAEGVLALRPQAAGLRQLPGPDGAPYPDVTIPFIGTLDLALDAVGAYLPGSIAATDPEAPGVAVLRRPTDITIRLGAEANRRGVFAFDGPYTVLRVQEISRNGFSGSWNSGADRDVAAGFFCAVKDGRER